MNIDLKRLRGDVKRLKADRVASPIGKVKTGATEIIRSNFDELVKKIEPVNEHQVVVGGVTIGTLAALWPFVMAYLRGNIDQSQLEAIFKKVLGESGVKLVARLSYATLFGPLFAWYLLARGVRGVVTLGQSHTVQRCSFYAPAQDF